MREQTANSSSRVAMSLGLHDSVCVIAGWILDYPLDTQQSERGAGIKSLSMTLRTWDDDTPEWNEENYARAAQSRISMVSNPYYEEWKGVRSKVRLWDLRYRKYRALAHNLGYSDDDDDLGYSDEYVMDQLQEINDWVVGYTQRFAWAIPNDEALAEIAKYSPLVEIGAGTGYWAWLLRQSGADILAFDTYPPNKENKNKFHTWADTWTEVLSGDESVLTSMCDRALFLCWPPPDHPMAVETLSKYVGTTVLFVGEDRPSLVTGNKDFFEQLDRDWVLEGNCNKVCIPQWPGRDDALWVYHRK